MDFRSMIKRLVGNHDNHVRIELRPVHGEEGLVESTSHLRSCADVDDELVELRAQVTQLTEKLAESEATVARQKELMERSLPIAFNCGGTIAELLDVDRTTLKPELAPDGGSVQVVVEGLTLNVFPFAEEVVVFITGTTEKVKFPVAGSEFALDVQDQIIGMHARSQRENPAAKPGLKLAGGLDVDKKTEAA